MNKPVRTPENNIPRSLLLLFSSFTFSSLHLPRSYSVRETKVWRNEIIEMRNEEMRFASSSTLMAFQVIYTRILKHFFNKKWWANFFHFILYNIFFCLGCLLEWVKIFHWKFWMSSHWGFRVPIRTERLSLDIWHGHPWLPPFPIYHVWSLKQTRGNFLSVRSIDNHSQHLLSVIDYKLGLLFRWISLLTLSLSQHCSSI